MYKKLLTSLCIIALLAVACNSKPQTTGEEQTNDYTPPAPGTIIAAKSMPITGDQLNHFNFSVQVATNQYSKNGTYDVTVAWGPETAKGAFTMPQGGGNLKPVIRKTDTAYTYIIGFYSGNDKTFYDYYQVSGQKGNIEMKYIKGYSFK